MYEDFYQLEKAPFGITPDPDFLYLSPSHKEALASIVYAIEQRKGFVAVLGEVGLGKTTILRYYLARHDARRLTTAYVFNPNVTFKALLDTIYQELGIADKPDDVFGMVKRLHQVVIEEYHQGRNVVLIVDEAQNMPIETLEQLRVLSNLEAATDKLLQIVLVGQPEFADRLDLRELRQLKQRISRPLHARAVHGEGKPGLHRAPPAQGRRVQRVRLHAGGAAQDRQARPGHPPDAQHPVRQRHGRGPGLSEEARDRPHRARGHWRPHGTGTGRAASRGCGRRWLWFWPLARCSWRRRTGSWWWPRRIRRSSCPCSLPGLRP